MALTEQHQLRPEHRKENGSQQGACQTAQRRAQWERSAGPEDLQPHKDEKAHKQAQYDSRRKGFPPVLFPGFAVAAPPVVLTMTEAAQNAVHHTGQRWAEDGPAQHTGKHQDQKAAGEHGRRQPKTKGQRTERCKEIGQDKAFPILRQKIPNQQLQSIGLAFCVISIHGAGHLFAI